jgi:hypothetical protein
MHPAQLPAGTRLPAGLGVLDRITKLDFETYSEAGYVWEPSRRTRTPQDGKWHGPRGAAQGKKGLGIVGAAVYAEHPSTEVLTLSYNLKDGRGVRRWRPGLPPPADLLDHVQRGGLLPAWNSAFEWWIWNCVGVRKYGWPPLNLFQLRCDMAKSRASGLPGKLATAGEFLGLDIQKDKRGDALAKEVLRPARADAQGPAPRIRPEEDPEGEALYGYCDTDTIAEAEASSRTPPTSSARSWIFGWPTNS